LRKKGRPGVGDVGKKRKETVLGVLDVEADEEVDGGASPRSGTGEVGHGVGGVHGRELLGGVLAGGEKVAAARWEEGRWG
jgi:hypothetical protein